MRSARAPRWSPSIPEVRQALLGLQRRFGSHGPGAVLAGRDIGTVVRPDASHKIFVTASRRRTRQAAVQGVAGARRADYI